MRLATDSAVPGVPLPPVQRVPAVAPRRREPGRERERPRDHRDDGRPAPRPGPGHCDEYAGGRLP